jgi:hypothetical protein
MSFKSAFTCCRKKPAAEETEGLVSSAPRPARQQARFLPLLFLASVLGWETLFASVWLTGMWMVLRSEDHAEHLAGHWVAVAGWGAGLVGGIVTTALCFALSTERVRRMRESRGWILPIMLLSIFCWEMICAVLWAPGLWMVLLSRDHSLYRIGQWLAFAGLLLGFLSGFTHTWFIVRVPESQRAIWRAEAQRLRDEAKAQNDRVQEMSSRV